MRHIISIFDKIVGIPSIRAQIIHLTWVCKDISDLLGCIAQKANKSAAGIA